MVCAYHLLSAVPFGFGYLKSSWPTLQSIPIATMINNIVLSPNSFIASKSVLQSYTFFRTATKISRRCGLR